MAQRLFPYPQIKFASNFNVRDGVEEFLDSMFRRKNIKVSPIGRGMALAAMAGGVSACGISTDTPGATTTPTPPPPPPNRTLRGEEGADTSISFSLNNLDEDSFGAGNDEGEGMAYDDSFYLGPGNDKATGGGGADVLDGGTGNDELDGGDGNDMLTGGAGSDTFTVSQGTDTIADYDPTADRLSFANYPNMNFNDLTFRALSDEDYHDDLEVSGYEPDSQLILIGALADDNIESLNDWFLQIADTQSQFDNALADLTVNYKDGDMMATPTDGDDTFNSNDAGRVFGFGGDDTITASSGIDVIYGGDGDDFLNGGGGDDIIYGGAGEDELNGGADKDTLRGGAGSDTLNGGADADMLNGDAGDDILNGDAGNDELEGGAGSDTLDGGAGDDMLTGGDSRDTYLISEGSDTILDYALSETLNFGEFKDSSDSPTIEISEVMFAEAPNGKDLTITGFGAGHTTTLKDVFDEGGVLHSMNLNDFYQTFASARTYGSGDDTYSIIDGLVFEYGGTAVDDDDNVISLTASGTLFGFAGDDELTGFSGDDTIFGGDGDDELNGGDGDDTLFGGDDDDALYGGAGDDTLTGGSNSDTFNVSWGNDTITDFRSSGRDYLGFSALLNDEDISTVVGSTTFSASVSNLRFTSGIADGTVAGADGEEDDLLIIFNDFRISSNINHTITLQDVFQSGGTFASYRTEESDTFTFDINGLIDDFTAYGNSSSSSSFIRGLELTYGTGDDDVTNDSNNTVTLTANSTHTLYGLSGSDQLVGNARDNTIYGGNGGDDINGGAGNDTLYGGRGSDDFFISSGSDTVQDFTTSDDIFFTHREISETVSGTMTMTMTVSTTFEINDIGFAINATDTDDLDITYEVASVTHTLTIKDLLGEDNPSVFGNSLGEAIAELTRDTSQYLYELDFATDASSGTTFSATMGDDIFFGWQGDDELNGGAGSDTLYAGEGSDTLNGEAGADFLYGSDGNDILDGGADDDILSGGDDTDTFVVSSGADTIIDYRTTSDRDIIDFTNATIGKLIFAIADDDVVISGYQVNNVAGTLTLQDALLSGFGFSNDDLGQVVGSITANEDSLTDIEAENLDDDDDDNDVAANPGYFRFADSFTDNIGDDEDNTETINTDFDNTDIYFALGGNDTITVLSQNGTAVYGGTGNDELTGGVAGDYLFGSAGEDTIMGLGGDDILSGGNSSDTINGGDDNDTITGGAGNDKLFGDAGNDTIDGGAGNDEIDGGEGNDSLTGGSGSDTFLVSSGADTISDFTSGDNLTFGDSITIAASGLVIDKTNSDKDLQITGFSFSSAASTITLAGAFEEDGIFYDDSTTAAIADKEAFAMIGSDDSIITGITAQDDSLTVASGSVALGLNGNDTLTGAGGAEWLFGGSGNDVLNGEAGNDLLYGGVGVDELNGGAGKDELYGGDGNDTLNANDGDDMLFGEAGNDRLVGGAGADELDGGAGNDTLNANDGDDMLIGGAGSDTLDGGDDDDILNGGSGNDTITGGDGNDTFVVSSGADTISDFTYSASGEQDQFDFSEFKEEDPDDETILTATLTVADFSFSESGDNIQLAGFGGTIILENALEEGSGKINDIDDFTNFIDYIYGETATLQDIIINFATDIADLDIIADDSTNTLVATDSTILLGFGGNDNLTAHEDGSTIYGGNGDDTIIGEMSNDRLFGNIGNDTINGGAGNDTLDGSVGDDIISGEAGNDTLRGGEGDDTLTGDFTATSANDDFSNDTFVISEGSDTITDFYSSDVETGERDVLNFSEFDNAMIQNLTFNKEANSNDLKIAGYSIGAGNEIILQGIFGTGGQFDGQDLHAALDVLTSSLTRIFSNLSGDWNDGNNVLTAEDGVPLFGFGGNDTINVSSDREGIVFGGDGSDTINGSGGNDEFYGGNHADLLNGNDGTDTLYGGAGGDILNGGDDDDMLFGGRGLDRLNGGDGDDELTGGAGRDTFQASAGSDTITDFSMDDEDVLDFSTIDDVSSIADLSAMIQGTNLQLLFTHDHDDDEDTAMVTATMTLNNVAEAGDTADALLQSFMTGDHLTFG